MKELNDMTFDELVTEMAGIALGDFVKGTPWRTVIFRVCQTVAQWSAERKKT